MQTLMIKIAMIVLLVYGGYTYYTDTQEKIERLTANTAVLQETNKVNETTIATMRTQVEDLKELNIKLDQELVKATEYSKELQGKLRKHDLTRLAMKKPKMVEDIINKSTAELFDEIRKGTK